MVRFWDVSRMGSFGGLGAEPPTAGGLAGPGAAAPAGVKGAEPLCFVIPVNRRFKLLVT